MSERRIKRILLVLIGTSFVLRACLASFLELGNDEVYYWTYAMFPDWSHFDHPPMVGVVMQIFSLNLTFRHEFFLRLPALVFGSFNIWLIYLVGKKLLDPQTGLYSAILFIASVYCSLISGTFILPDSPQLFFWLLSLYAFLEAFTRPLMDRKGGYFLMLAGLSAGFALLSKYTSVFLWFGAFLFIAIYQRAWFRKRAFYLSLLITLICFIPVIAWNLQHHFVSFTYQGERVGAFKYGFRPDFFLTEIAGEVLYNNPVNFIIYMVALIGLFKSGIARDIAGIKFLLMVSFPLILLFWLFSMFRSTLPHWTGPAFVTFIPACAYYFRKINVKGIVPVSFRIAMAFLLIGVFLGFGQVRYGILYNGDVREKGKLYEDPSLDLYGWHQLGEKFSSLLKNDKIQHKMSDNTVMLSWRWFPAANLDYYVACPNGIKLYAAGDLERIHKYAWINSIRGPIAGGTDAYFICSSRDYKNPEELTKITWDKIMPPDTLPVYRGHSIVMWYFVYRMKGIRSSLPDPPIN